MKVVLLVTLAAIICAVDLADSAAVRSEEFAERLRTIVHDVYPDSLRTQRNTESGKDDRPPRPCNDTPCGWNSYNPLTRRSTNFMLNTCVCPDETYKCVHTGENVSMRAYVYHCRQNTTSDEGESPNDMESLDYVS